jgi:hypothetical protein
MSPSSAREWSGIPRGKACIPILQILRDIDPDTQCESKFPWLFVPRENEFAGLERRVASELRTHCCQTRHRHPVKAKCDPDKLFAKMARRLEFDFFLPRLNTAVEFDERQHFTEERRVTLECYRGLEVAFDRERWAQLCSPKIQDPDPPCRDWRRAFRDAVRDIRATQQGLRLVRIYEDDFNSAKCADVGALDRLRAILIGNQRSARSIGQAGSVAHKG